MEQRSTSQWKREQVFVQVEGTLPPLVDQLAQFRQGGVQDEPHLDHSYCKAHEENTHPNVVRQTIRHALIRYGVPAMDEHQTQESATRCFQPNGFVMRNSSAGSVRSPIWSSSDVLQLPVLGPTVGPRGPQGPTMIGAFPGAHAGCTYHGQSVPNMERRGESMGPQSYGNAHMPYSSTSSHMTNSIRVLPSPGTSMDHGFQACQRDPVAHQSEHETAQARRSLEALEGKTTLVVRNIPARFTQQEILNHVWVPEGAFDFLFMPHSFKLGQTVGYSFINFTCTSHARAFHRQWHRATLPGGSKGKPLDIHAACFQGLYENLRYLATSDVMRIRNPRFHPCVFNGKHRIDFMAALQSLGLLASGV